jgi:hypothetical protein
MLLFLAEMVRNSDYPFWLGQFLSVGFRPPFVRSWAFLSATSPAFQASSKTGFCSKMSGVFVAQELHRLQSNNYRCYRVIDETFREDHNGVPLILITANIQEQLR